MIKNVVNGKKIISFILMVVVLLTSTISITFATEKVGTEIQDLNEIRYVLEDVGVKSSINENSENINDLIKDEAVNVTGITNDGVWLRVLVDNKEGFVKTNKLTTNKPEYVITNLHQKTMYVLKNITFMKKVNSTENPYRTLYKNEVVKVIGSLEGTNYYKVIVDKTIGYVHKNYLTMTKPEFTISFDKKTVYCTNTANIKTGPGKSYENKVLVSPKVVMTTMGKVNGKNYYLVMCGNYTGYIYGEYINTNKPDYTLTIKNTTMYCIKEVKLRKGPGKSYDSKRTVIPKELLEVRGKVNGKNYYLVKVGNYIGYIYGENITSKKPAFTISKYNKIMYCTKTVKFRTGPSDQYKKITSITPNEKVQVIAKVNNKNYYQVKYNDRIGYVYKNYLTTKKPKFVITKLNEYKYTTCKLPIKKNVGDNYSTIKNVLTNTKLHVTGKIKNSRWYRVEYNGKVGYVNKNCLSSKKTNCTVIGTYKDSTSKITVYKEWFKNAWVYAAHVEYSDYDRLKTTKAYGGGHETTSHAASRLGAVLAVNGDYNADSKGGVVRNKKVYKDKGYCDAGGVYNQKTGIFECGYDLKGSLTSLVKKGRITDTMSFGYQANYIKDGELCRNIWGDSRAQRTFMGTTGKAGDIWLCVSDGRYNDGKSAGLKYIECGEYLLTKNCTFAVPLDGGGSSTMVFKGKVLNAARNGQRAVVDFVYFKY